MYDPEIHTLKYAASIGDLNLLQWISKNTSEMFPDKDVFLAAGKKGHTHIIKYCFHTYYNSPLGRSSCVLLLIACIEQFGYVSCLQVLHEEYESMNEKKYEILNLACQRGFFDIVTFYICSSKWNFNNLYIYRCLREVSRYDRLTIVQLLCERIGETQYFDYSFKESIKYRSWSVAKYFITTWKKKCKSKTFKDIIKHKFCEAVSFLLALDAVDHAENYFIFACKIGYAKTISEFLTYGKYTITRSLLKMLIQKNRRWNIVEMLARRAPFNFVIDMASYYGKLCTIKFLIQMGYTYGENALIQACIKGHLHIIQYLVTENPNLRIENALRIACGKKILVLFDILLILIVANQTKIRYLKHAKQVKWKLFNS
jgi:hypothetical protein